jgi:hypothetical protein
MAPIHAVAVVTDPKDKSRFDQRACIAFEFYLHASTPKHGSLGDNLMAGAAAKLRRTQHMLPRRDRPLEDLGADLALQGMIGAGVPGIRHAPIAVSKVLGQGIQTCTIAKRCDRANVLRASRAVNRSPGRTVAGELHIAGPDSQIVLRDDAVFSVNGEPNLCITGTLYDQTKITLMTACERPKRPIRGRRRGRSRIR